MCNDHTNDVIAHTIGSSEYIVYLDVNIYYSHDLAILTHGEYFAVLLA